MSDLIYPIEYNDLNIPIIITYLYFRLQNYNDLFYRAIA